MPKGNNNNQQTTTNNNNNDDNNYNNHNNNKFELTPARGQQQRVAIALITSCEQTDTGGASQPAVKSFGMEKMQLLEPGMGTQAVHVFQRLRRLTMRLNPANEDVPKPTLHVDEDSSSPFKKARTLSSMPTDESLKETSL